jgi:putative tryptophan/tyrosine transport system substrate-binding protein
VRRRAFITLLGGAVVSPLAVHAQQTGKVARVGVLAVGAVVSAKDIAISSELARLGYVDGRNIAYEIRAADGDLSRLSAVARDLVRTKPDVLISASTEAAEALAAATRDIPIVMTVMLDPIAAGLSDSMSRPSRNLTGFTSSSATLAAKRLELLNELIPGLRKVAYLGAPAASTYASLDPPVRRAADALGITVVFVPITTDASVPESFEVVDREQVQAVIVGLTLTNTRVSGHIVDQCVIRDLPSIHPWPFEVDAGALMSYGPKALENHAGAARYIDRILKGAKISELPFEEPTEFKLAINLRTARSIKLKVPPTLLARADEVIE